MLLALPIIRSRARELGTGHDARTTGTAYTNSFTRSRCRFEPRYTRDYTASFVTLYQTYNNATMTIEHETPEARDSTTLEYHGIRAISWIKIEFSPSPAHLSRLHTRHITYAVSLQGARARTTAFARRPNRDRSNTKRCTTLRFFDSLSPTHPPSHPQLHHPVFFSHVHRSFTFSSLVE